MIKGTPDTWLIVAHIDSIVDDPPAQIDYPSLKMDVFGQSYGSTTVTKNGRASG